MLLDTWYIVMAFPPQCLDFLEKDKIDAHAWLPYILNEMADAEPAAHLTVGAVMAQACCVQRQLQKGNSMTKAPDLCKLLGSGPFDMWMRDDLERLARRIQVCGTGLPCLVCCMTCSIIGMLPCMHGVHSCSTLYLMS